MYISFDSQDKRLKNIIFVFSFIELHSRCLCIRMKRQRKGWLVSIFYVSLHLKKIMERLQNVYHFVLQTLMRLQVFMETSSHRKTVCSRVHCISASYVIIQIIVQAAVSPNRWRRLRELWFPGTSCEGARRRWEPIHIKYIICFCYSSSSKCYLNKSTEVLSAKCTASIKGKSTQYAEWILSLFFCYRIL